jgi:dihydropteroate synthase
MMSALEYDPDSMAIAAAAQVPIVLMHSQGTPETMQDRPSYQHVLLDVYDYLEGRIEACEAAGIARSALITDPGIGFGKRVVQDNLALINGLPLFLTLGCPLLLGASRKRFIGAITGEEVADRRMPGSLAAAIRGVELGAQIVRVHDVAETVQAMRLTQAFHDAAIMDG